MQSGGDLKISVGRHREEVHDATDLCNLIVECLECWVAEPRRFVIYRGYILCDLLDFVQDVQDGLHSLL